MALIGRALLIMALGTAAFGIGASLYGARTGRREWVDVGRRCVYALAAMATLAFAILEDAFFRSDFSFNVVAGHSSTTTPMFYKLAAAWSSQEGSLLLWVFLLSVWSSLILFLVRNRAREITPYATAVLLGFAAFFTSLATFWANPFYTSANPPAEGAGLDPLLLHPSMMIHPPMLYSGYTLLTIPFAFAIGALITGRLGAEWISLTRRFALAAWLFLGIGVLLGARWSYTELGWGGYWAWDPVENAALMPWLCITAFIHSVMIQEKRGMLKVWNVSLVLAAGTLSILGTFLVRSGILDSIHAFGASTLGVPFVLLLAVMVLGSIGLIVWRRDLLRSDARLESLLSREAVFLFQNLVLVGMVFVIFWITFFPLISQALTGTKVSVGPPAFRPFIVPLALILVLLSGVGPIIAWRRVTLANLRRNFAIPVAAGLVTFFVLLFWPGGPSSRPFALIMFALAGFVLTSVGQELWRGVAARRAMTHDPVPIAFVGLIRRNRRRYGGYIVHAGLAVLLVGVAGSSSFQHSQDVIMSPGQKASVDGYTIRYVRPTESVSDQKISFGAVLNVSKSGKHVTTITTTRSFYPSQNPYGRPRGQVLRHGQLRQPGRPGCGPAARHLDGGQRRPHAAGVADQQGQQSVRRVRAPGDDPGGEAVAGSGADHDEHALGRARPGGDRDRQAVRHPSVADRVPADRGPTRELALARRADHGWRRADRAVAGAVARPPAGHRSAQGPARGLARAGPRAGPRAGLRTRRAWST